MGSSIYRSRQDLNNAMVSQCADDLRRVCDMAGYRRGLGDGIEIAGIRLEMAPIALDILGLRGVQALATALPDRHRRVHNVVHYHVDGNDAAHWQAEPAMLVVLACPWRPPAAYPYRHEVKKSPLTA